MLLTNVKAPGPLVNARELKYHKQHLFNENQIYIGYYIRNTAD